MQLSVIVPAFNAARTLEACLRGLISGTLPRTSWELLVVDDGSDDDTAAIAARHADRVTTVEGGPLGPANARNVAARIATAPVLVFLDADVVPAADMLERFAARFARPDGADAVFGAYDDEPADPGFVSQYRNLLHHRVHTLSAGPAVTFWAGCGAVRRAAFLEVGGFDAHRYPTPQVEDIELGYRLSEAGFRIELDPTIRGKHLKRWTLLPMLRTDFKGRAVPWMELLLERGHALADGPLNAGRREKWMVAFTGGGLLLVVAGLMFASPWTALFGVALLLLVGVLEAPLLGWFMRRRGIAFTLRAALMRLLFHTICGLAALRVLVSPRRLARDLPVVQLNHARGGPSA